jgi:hypothetical protein
MCLPAAGIPEDQHILFAIQERAILQGPDVPGRLRMRPEFTGALSIATFDPPLSE